MPPIQYKPSPDAIYCVGESLTEQEHVPDCDINRMIGRAAQGLPIRGSLSAPLFGEENPNMDLMDVRLEKERLESGFREMADGQLTEEEISKLPKKLRDKFGFKAKPKAPGVATSVASTAKPSADGKPLVPNVDGPSGAVKPDGAPSSDS